MSVMPTSLNPNLQLIYVTDIERSTAFYTTLFQAKPVFSSPRYVAFSADEQGQALFAIWTGGTPPEPHTPRFSEIGVMLSSDQEVESLFEIWQKRPQLKILKPPYTEVFGRTFLVADPDGHVIRVCSRD
jgi:predicted enzyme related to lactoylglutathione lyase